MLRIFRKLNRDERGVTGLETAIILIAFVVVASVFGYTVLSAGIFSTQRGQEAVYAGLEQARSTFSPRGDVIAFKGTIGTTDAVAKITFTVGVALPGEKIDLTPPYTATAIAIGASGLNSTTTIAYQDAKQYIAAAAWTVSFIGSNNGDYMLEDQEKADITVWLLNYTASAYALGAGATDPFIDSAGNLLTNYTNFSLEAKPTKGASVSISRATGSRIDAVMNFR